MKAMLLLFVFYLLKTIFLVHGQTGDKMTPNNSILDGQTLVSAGGVFELGFFSPGGSKKRFLGIWYKNFLEQTVVWVANRDVPVVNTNGALNLTSDGNLALLNSTGHTLWSTGTSNTINPVLQLLDTGNLVLTGGDSSRMIWQSFDHPTDTFLPAMKIGFDYRTKLVRYLTSWKSATDPSPGEYSFGTDNQGIPQEFLWKGTTPISRSSAWNGKGFSGLPIRSSNNVFFFQYTNNQNECYYTFQLLDPTTTLGRATLNYSGQYQSFVWNKGSSAWILVLDIPSGQCDQYARCGGNGLCTTSYSPPCQCLQGFEPKFPEDWSLWQNSGGCVRRKALNCSTDGFLPLQNVKLPDARNASATNRTPDDCTDWCLKNCSCNAYAVIEGNGCLTWFGDLLDIRMFSDGGDEVYIRLAASELASLMGNSGKKKTKMIVLISLASGILLLFFLFLLWSKYRGEIRSKQGKKKIFQSIKNGEDQLELPLFDMLTIRAATNDFSNENVIGKGGFGPVYKGQLEDGLEIAVKRLSKDSVQGLREFKTEVQLIAKLQHKNLVRLLGCCIEEDERILVYEYMQNKSLDAFLFDKTRVGQLNWQRRLEIITGIARGLLYLHHDSRLKIIHRDLKTSNILLDKDMNPKISDFGTARIFKVDQNEENTKRVVGTYGYMSPEYAMQGTFSEKSDVFSFGVIVLEIISGRRNRTVSHSEPHKTLLQYAWRLWTEGSCLELVDEALGCSYPKSRVMRYIQVGLLCVQEGMIYRPSMHEVVVMLSSEDVMLPKPARAFYPTSALGKDCTSSNEISITQLEGR